MARARSGPRRARAACTRRGAEQSARGSVAAAPRFAAGLH